MTRVAAIVLLLVAFVLIPGHASAHANLAESDPAANSVLETPPSEVTIRFTEPLEAALSEIRVLDSRGKQVDLGDSALDSGDPTVMSVSLGLLDNGTYTVAWSNVSTVDGHRVRGAFLFSVGEPLSVSVSAPLDDQPLLQSPAEPFVRWLVLVSGLALVGVLAFRLLVSVPALSRMESEGMDSLRAALSSNTMMLVWAALVVFLSMSVLRLALQASVVYDTSFIGALSGPAWSLVTETEWGRLWILRMGFAAAAGGVLFTLRGRFGNAP